MTVTVMKATFEKVKPKISQFREHEQFYNDKFRKKNMLSELSLQSLRTNYISLERTSVYLD